MDATTKSSRVFRFSVFEVDLESGELFKQGRKVRLQGLPFEILVALLQRPGDVVTREDLRKKCSPADLLIDFDQGLNRAINKIRDALNDSADTPRFIETVPRRGYRFLAPVQQESLTTPPPTAVEPLPSPISPKKRRTIWIAAISAAIVVVFVAVWRANHPRAEKAPLRLRQLTTNSAENPIDHAVISADGKYLAWSDRAGIQIRLIGSAESHVLPRPDVVSAGDIWVPVAWFPDQTHILASSLQLTSSGLAINAWSVAVIGGGAVLIREHAGRSDRRDSAARRSSRPRQAHLGNAGCAVHLGQRLT